MVARRRSSLEGFSDLASKDQISQGPRVFIRSKATCAAPLREVLTPCRGLRPHHVHKDRVELVARLRGLRIAASGIEASGGFEDAPFPSYNAAGGQRGCLEEGRVAG